MYTVKQDLEVFLDINDIRQALKEYVQDHYNLMGGGDMSVTIYDRQQVPELCAIIALKEVGYGE